MHNECITRFDAFTKIVQRSNGTEAGLRTIWFACIWSIWKARNAKIFQDKNISALAITEQAKLLLWNWLRVKSRSFDYDISQWMTNPITCLETVKWMVILL
ncbi:unnamed protein product [Trifolium pratense]|uniref:Uncharacterized protein n=1 Tax=Trifolium pratense TaxID=57577 RepID=A0ACB0K7R4_TRIPR|nr:unnamed protein product [Trifolium pratense]